MIYTVNMQVSCEVDDANAIRRHAERLLGQTVPGPDADKWIGEYTKTTEHCLSVILGSEAIAGALRASAAPVDGLDIVGVYVQVDQVRAQPAD